MNETTPPSIAGFVPAADNSSLIEYRQDGRLKRTTATFYRGPHSNFNPTDESLGATGAIADCAMKGWAPRHPFIGRSSPVVAFGSCFAAHIANHLFADGYDILTKKNPKAYVSNMGDGMVNTFAIRQQFDWAWDRRVPRADLWHGYDARSFGYRDDVRAVTEAMFDQADVFIITLGLSEIWYDEPTGEVFWRAVPYARFDPQRHKFRVSSVAENLANLRAIHASIRKRRPGAAIVLTLSPVPLTATFRAVACVSANAVSKAILRVAIDELLRELAPTDAQLHYFPSYEIVTGLFQNAFMEDRKHPHHHVLDLVMKTFQHSYCVDSVDATALDACFTMARELDRRVGAEGHFSVPRTMNPKAGGAKPDVS